jgi:hypothetical protein
LKLATFNINNVNQARDQAAGLGAPEQDVFSAAGYGAVWRG